MGGLLQILADWIQVEECDTLEQRLFRGLTLAGGLMCLLVVMPMNLVQGMPARVNLSVGLFGAACLLLFWATFHGY